MTRGLQFTLRAWVTVFSIASEHGFKDGLLLFKHVLLLFEHVLLLFEHGLLLGENMV